MFGAEVRRSMTAWTLTWLCGESKMCPMITALCFSHCCAHQAGMCLCCFLLDHGGREGGSKFSSGSLLLKRSDPLTRAALMICGPRRTSGRAPCGIFERGSERRMNWTDKAGRENTVRLNNSKPTGGMLERNRSRDLSLGVCSRMLTVILAVCLSP